MNYLNLLQVSGASVLALTVVHSITFAIARRIAAAPCFEVSKPATNNFLGITPV